MYLNQCVETPPTCQEGKKSITMLYFILFLFFCITVYYRYDIVYKCNIEKLIKFFDLIKELAMHQIILYIQ